MENVDKIEEFVKTPIDGHYLSHSIEFDNESRKNFNEDIINAPFDLIQTIDLNIESSCYTGRGMARVNLFEKTNWEWKHV